MGVNKVIYYGEVLVDMSQVTVTPDTLGAGKTALNAAGELIEGTASVAGGGAETVNVEVFSEDCSGSMWYTGADFTLYKYDYTGNETINVDVLKNSIVMLAGYELKSRCDTGGTKIHEISYMETMRGNGVATYRFYSDCTLTIYNTEST